MFKYLLLTGLGLLLSTRGNAALQPLPFVQKHCLECHDSDSRKGGLDLSTLRFDPTDPDLHRRWVKVLDRVEAGEMPPKNKSTISPQEWNEFRSPIAEKLVSVELARFAREGRSSRRRLNRYEYENTLRDLLHAPWLQIRDALPEDGESNRYNKIGEALDVSHVQMARYLSVADYALRQVMATREEKPASTVRRYYARDQRSYTGPMKFSVFNTAPERATFPVLGFKGQPDVRSGKAPLSSTNAEIRELEGIGVVASAYEPIEPKFNQFRAPAAGRYKLRFNAYSVWVGPGESNKWFIPNLDDISRGRRDEPITITAETPPRLLRKLGDFDITPDPSVHELEVWLLSGEMIRPDAGRLFRSRPGAGRWQNPLAEKDGQPGVVFRWMEVEGPLHDQWPPAGHQLLFGKLPFRNLESTAASSKSDYAEPSRASRPDQLPRIEVVSNKPAEEATRLLAGFIKKAIRKPTDARHEARRFLPVVLGAMKRGSSFTEAMIAGYTAVLCSPEFVYLNERPGRLDDHALASRLSYFLWNSPPDETLTLVADQHRLSQPAVLREQTDRLLKDPKARRFVEAFLDYWLDLRKILATAPDAELYSDYYLDDLLTDSALEESRAFFEELIQGNLPASNIVDSRFAMLNERLALHYGLPPIAGITLRKTPIPGTSPRGGLLTQASVLKVTSNGTTTSPVVRGVWIMERILGQKPPPPPPGVPAVEPDIRGAATIRQQLGKHRTQPSCNSCHARIDPAGFALENFDVMGGWRDRYRAATAEKPEKGIAKSGQKFSWCFALPVDAGGQLPDGRNFAGIQELKGLLLADERQIARNLVQQLAIYATGSPIHYSDRTKIEAILDQSQSGHYPVRTLIQELIQSDLFRNK